MKQINILFSDIVKKFGRIPLRLKIWIYFVIYTIIVFVLLWLFQIIFLENFYENMKIRDVITEGEFLAESYLDDSLDDSTYEKLLNQSSTKNDMCIEILDKYGRSVHSEKAFGDCLIHSRDGTLATMLSKLKKSKTG